MAGPEHPTATIWDGQTAGKRSHQTVTGNGRDRFGPLTHLLWLFYDVRAEISAQCKTLSG